MLPILIGLGPIKIYSYAVAFILAVFLFGFMVWKRGRELHFEESELFDASIVIVLWGLLVSRLTYVLLIDFQSFRMNLWQIANLVGKPGMWQAGFLIGAGMAAGYQAKKRKWDLFDLTDILLSAYVLFQAIMAVGAFLNGSGYGIIANNFMGFRFKGLLDKHVPVQLYEVFVYGAIFWFLSWVENKYRTFSWYKGSKSEALSGFITAWYFILVGTAGLMLTLVKIPQMVWWGVRFDYLWELGYLGIGVGILYRRAGNRVSKSYSSWTNRQVKEQPQTPQSPAQTSRWSHDIFN